MNILQVLAIIMNVVIGLYLIGSFLVDMQDMKYQKKWYEEKEMRIKLKPNISRAELCEYYIMFCKRNNCKVDF